MSTKTLSLTDTLYLQALEELLEELQRPPTDEEIDLRTRELLEDYCACGPD